jgi:hypothetical protein
MDQDIRPSMTTARKLPDALGMLSSGLCLLHCLGAPLLLTLGLELFTDEWLKYPFLLLSMVAVYFAGKRCRHGIGSVMWASFAVLFFATLFMEEYPWLHYVAYLASAAMILCHALNLIHHRSNTSHD